MFSSKSFRVSGLSFRSLTHFEFIFVYGVKKCSNFIHLHVAEWHTTPVLLPGNSHGRRNLAGCSPWDRLESDTTERLHFHFSLSCIGEGNGNPLQCSCLENPRDGGAWWAAVYGSHRVGHNWSDLAAAVQFPCTIYWRNCLCPIDYSCPLCQI